MKKIRSVLIATLLLTVACGGNSTPKTTTPLPPTSREYTYIVRATYPHAETSYTQGLHYANGILWEGTGQNGHSVLQKIDLLSGSTEVVARLPRTDFGEGITALDGKIYQLTWQSNKAYVYDAATGKLLREHRYPGEGWGLTTDGQKLYLSDGTARIYTVEPEGFKRTGSITVTLRGEPVHYLNELEWIDGKIWANVYTTDLIVMIDPATGIVEGIIDLSGILPDTDKTPATDVLNGIAYDASTGRIFVTGKNWKRLFEIAITEK